MTRTVFSDLSNYGHDEDFHALPATTSTSAECGSREKVEVMRRRVEQGQSPFHELDNRAVVPPRWVPHDQVPGIRELRVVVGGYLFD